MLQDMHACLKQLCASSTIGDPEAVARMIAEKISAMNVKHGCRQCFRGLGQSTCLASTSSQARGHLARHAS